MVELKFINSRNIEMNAIHNQYMTITDIEALHGVDNEFSSSRSPFFDGEVISHIRANPRIIVLTYVLKTPIERSLNYFNSIVKSKQKATLIETKDDGTEIEIEGIVTVPPYTRLSEQVAVQIQLYCSDPYWQDVLTVVTDVSDVIDKHYFPFENEERLLANDGGLYFPAELDEGGNIITDGIVFSEIDKNSIKTITNDGDVSTGLIIQIVALSTATNPRITINNYNWIGLGSENKPVVLNEGDVVTISTVRGDKYVKPSIERPDISIADIIYSGNDWLQLETGDNELYARSEEGSGTIYFSIFYKRKWQ